MLKLSSAFGLFTNESICFFMYKYLGVVSSVQSLESEAAAIAKSWQISTHNSISKFSCKGYGSNGKLSELRTC